MYSAHRLQHLLVSPALLGDLYCFINEVVDWFREIQIPIHLADEIEEIYMDGGNEIYHQIIPFWDGEDDYFDINKISSEELKQFKNLKKMTVMSNKYEEIAEVLEANGIESIQL